MDDPQNDFDSVQWRRDDEHQQASPLPRTPLKSNGKRRQSGGPSNIPDPIADAVDNAGIGTFGYLDTVVDKPQKENDGTKDAFVSYMVTTSSDFKTFARSNFSVRRRFTDFVYLYKSLFRQYSYLAIPPLPEKHNLEYVRGDRFGPDFTQRRAHALHRFIKRISLHHVLRRNPTFLMFLETPDWNAVMRGRERGSSISESTPGPALLTTGPVASSSSLVERFQDWGINLFKAPHKPDKRFVEVKEKADKFDEDCGHVEKIVARVARREGDLESDYLDLATQIRKLVNMEPGVADSLTSFASSVETTSQAWKGLKNATDQDYLGSLRDMSSYVASLRALLKVREQKQLDFEGLTDYLNRAANERDQLASHRGTPTLSSGPSSYIRSKMEDFRGVDQEQSRRERLRRTEMDIERLTREVEEAKRTTEAFDDQVVQETAEFERIKACEFRDTLGSLADNNIAFWQNVTDTWEEFLKGMEKEDEERRKAAA